MNADDPTARRRAEVVAGIRALADLLEQDTSLPLPQAISAHHSLPGQLNDEGRQLIRDMATHLGIAPDAASGVERG